MKTEKTRKRLYLVQFGDSDTYRYVYIDTNSKDTIWNHPQPLAEVEEKLRAFLTQKFPEDSALAYYYTPKLQEVSWEHREDYVSYPEFDDKAFDAVKKTLLEEVEKDQALRSLNNNAPQADAPV